MQGDSLFAQGRDTLQPDRLCARMALPFGGFVVLWPLGIVVGVLTPVVWVAQVPASWMSGGLIAFPMGLVPVG